MKNKTTRRNFLRQSTLGTLAVGLALPASATKLNYTLDEPIFKISLAQWSLNPLLFGGKMDNLEFAPQARAHGIEAVEYVNQFFMDKGDDTTYIKQMKSIADSEGVKSLLIMCDREGRLGDPDAAERAKAVENHHKWVRAAQMLGCHSIRVNGYSEGSKEEQMKLVSDGLHQLCVFADNYDINVIIENHGGYSSDGKWLAATIEAADHPRAGTLPDFGNFRISGGDGEPVKSYDSYRGVKELMPYAKGVSLKTTVYDDNGEQHPLDYDRMLRIVLDSGFRGYCGIEHTDAGNEWNSIVQVRKQLEAARDKLSPEYQ